MADSAVKLDSNERAAPDADTRGDRTRKLIKRVIARLAARRDISDISLADICDAAKLTTGAVYFHFKSKDEAIEEMVIDEVHHRYSGHANWPETDNFAQLVTRLLDMVGSFHQTHKQLPRAIQVVINTRPKAYQAWLSARRPLISRFERAIEQARRENGLVDDQAPYLAHFILNSIEDLAMDAFQWRNPTLAPYAQTLEDWNRRQSALWSWAILAPIPTQS